MSLRVSRERSDSGCIEKLDITSIKDACLSSRYDTHKLVSPDSYRVELTSFRYILT